MHRATIEARRLLHAAQAVSTLMTSRDIEDGEHPVRGGVSVPQGSSSGQRDGRGAHCADRQSERELAGPRGPRSLRRARRSARRNQEAPPRHRASLQADLNGSGEAVAATGAEKQSDYDVYDVDEVVFSSESDGGEDKGGVDHCSEDGVGILQGETQPRTGCRGRPALYEVPEECGMEADAKKIRNKLSARKYREGRKRQQREAAAECEEVMALRTLQEIRNEPGGFTSLVRPLNTFSSKRELVRAIREVSECAGIPVSFTTNTALCIIAVPSAGRSEESDVENDVREDPNDNREISTAAHERLQLDRGVNDLERREPSAVAQNNSPPPESADSEPVSGAVTACLTAKPPIYVKAKYMTKVSLWEITESNVEATGETFTGSISRKKFARVSAYTVEDVAKVCEDLVRRIPSSDEKAFRNLLDKYMFDSEALRSNFISRVRRAAMVSVFGNPDSNAQLLPLLKKSLEIEGHVLEYGTVGAKEMAQIVVGLGRDEHNRLRKIAIAKHVSKRTAEDHEAAKKWEPAGKAAWLRKNKRLLASVSQGDAKYVESLMFCPSSALSNCEGLLGLFEIDACNGKFELNTITKTFRFPLLFKLLV